MKFLISYKIFVQISGNLILEFTASGIFILYHFLLLYLIGQIIIIFLSKTFLQPTKKIILFCFHLTMKCYITPLNIIAKRLSEMERHKDIFLLLSLAVLSSSSPVLLYPITKDCV